MVNLITIVTRGNSLAIIIL